MPAEANVSIGNEPHFQVETVAEHLSVSKQGDDDVQVQHFVAAYQELNKFVGMLGTIFHFVQKDVNEKTERLLHLLNSDGKAYRSVSVMLDSESTSKKKPGASALLALHRALEFIIDFMGALINASDDDSVSAICRESYDRTLARFHKWVIRKAVGLASYTLPNRRSLIENIQGSNPSEEVARASVAKMSEWKEVRLKGVPIEGLTFSPDNTRVALFCGCDVFIYLLADNKQKINFECNDHIVNGRFSNCDTLETVTVNGELTQWDISSGSAVSKNSRRVTAFPVRHVLWTDDGGECIWVVEQNKETDTIYHLTADLSLEQVSDIPSSLQKDQIALGDGYVTYCLGHAVHVLPLYEDSDISKHSFIYTSNIEGKSPEENEKIQFSRIAAAAELVAASLNNGKVLVWSKAASEPISLSNSHTIHWHKVSAPMRVTKFGGILSAGAETVLCKFPLVGQPSFLTRLSAPVSQLYISQDSSLAGLVMDDNTAYIVLTASMSILCPLPSVIHCTHSNNNVFTRDPRAPKMVVLNAKPGSIQWLNVETRMSKNSMSVSNENVVDGDMTFVGITPSFYDVENVVLCKNKIGTLEALKNFETIEKRLRFWQRSIANAYSVTMEESLSVDVDTSFLSGCMDPLTDEDVVFITCTRSGVISVWETWMEGSRWRLSVGRRMHWQNSPIRCVSSIQRGPLWASAHITTGKNDCVAVWKVDKMRVVDVIQTDGAVSAMDWASESLLIISTDKSVSCWDIATGTTRWTVEQSLNVAVSEKFGAYAWSDDQVIEFDPTSGHLLKSIRFSSNVQILIPVSSQQERKSLVAKTEKGLCVMSSFVEDDNRMEIDHGKTPFSVMPSHATEPEPTLTRLALPKVPNALKLLDGPCYSLPPLSHIAPIFISSCLAPPPEA